MKKQTMTFAVMTKDKVVQQVGRSIIIQPVPKFKGGTIKWYEDKPKQKSN